MPKATKATKAITVTIRMPGILDGPTTPRERNALKNAFQTELLGVLEQSERATDAENWNINRVETEIIVIGGKPNRRRGAKKKSAKKSAKKK